ncbi:MAG TPA: LOG family protein [Caldithrix abyssi]|uniref:AMP nucleosidase n=1 Tax=Caldithrix abyssi TaxID=187145 RepID=A0A7V4U3L5_CALAY|nr:LOG family protein [Caldithrix abyssi]
MPGRKKRPPKAYRNIEFLTSSRARPIRILAEFLEPYHRFKDMEIESTIVFFGSARIQPKTKAKARLKELAKICDTDPSPENVSALSAARLQLRLSNYYEEAVKLAKLLTKWTMDKETGKQKYYVCSGGGPGIMEAANKGASKAGGKSIGLNISIPHEQYPNPYITDELMFEFHYFFMRKYWFVYLAKALIIFPGGFGTLDELMEVLTLIQTKKLTKPLPIIVFGQDYWKEVIDIEAMAKWGTISPQDLELFKVVNTAEEAFRILQELLE